MMQSDGGLLGSLTVARSVRTKQISAENPTGARGEGATTVPDPSDPSLPHSRAAEDLGVGFKVRPFISLPARSEATLADITGAGVITNFFITSNIPDFRKLRLRIWWDDRDVPSVDVSVADFFCLGGPGHANTVTSVPVVVGPVRGCTSQWRMPFSAGARLVILNESDIDADVIAYKVTWEERSPESIDEWRFHAVTCEGSSDPATAEFDIARIEGAGLFVGVAVNWRAETMRWWGEGEVKFYHGDDEFPSLVDTGTEDYFGGAWGFGRDAGFVPGGPIGERSFSGPYAGVPYIDTNEGYSREIVLYRWHLNDPIGFDEGLRVAVQALGQGPGNHYEVRSRDILRATGIWYA